MIHRSRETLKNPKQAADPGRSLHPTSKSISKKIFREEVRHAKAGKRRERHQRPHRRALAVAASTTQIKAAEEVRLQPEREKAVARLREVGADEAVHLAAVKVAKDARPEQGPLPGRSQRDAEVTQAWQPGEAHKNASRPLKTVDQSLPLERLHVQEGLQAAEGQA